MINRIGKARIILHEEGFLALFKQLLLFLKQYLFVYSSYNIYETTLDTSIIPCQIKDLTLRVITRPEEVDQLVIDGLVPKGIIAISRLEEVLNMGGIMFCASVDKELAHVELLGVSKQTHEAYPFSFARGHEGSACQMGQSTALRYQLRGLHPHVFGQSCHYLKKKGISKLWGVLPSRNMRAQYMIVRSGAVKVGSYYWGEGCRLRLLSLLTIEWVTPKSRALPSKMRCLLRYE